MVSNLPVETERRGEYVIWNMREWDGDDDVLGDLEERWVEIHSDSSVEGSVVVLNDDLRLGSGFQEHIETRWSSLIDRAGVEKMVWVSDGITALAVTANLEVDGLTSETAETIPDATEWIETEAPT